MDLGRSESAVGDRPQAGSVLVRYISTVSRRGPPGEILRGLPEDELRKSSPMARARPGAGFDFDFGPQTRGRRSSAITRKSPVPTCVIYSPPTLPAASG